MPGVEQLIPISEERVAVVGEVDVKVLDTISGNVVSTIPVLQGEVLTCNSKCQLLIDRDRPFPGYLQLLDGTTLVWQKKGLFESRSFLQHRSGAFSPKEQFLVVSAEYFTLVLDPETGNTLRTLDVSFFDPRYCIFISDDTYVVSGKESTVRLFNVKSGELLTEIDVEIDVTCLAACPFNRVLAIGLEHSTSNFKVIRVHLPRDEDRGNMKR